MKLIVSVTDSGIGLDDHEISHIFKPFSQADSSTTRIFGGTGLGLCTTKKYVELMGVLIRRSRILTVSGTNKLLKREGKRVNFLVLGEGERGRSKGTRY